MGVNEQSTALTSMKFDAGGTTVQAWTGGQYVGPCIPGFATADRQAGSSTTLHVQFN